MYAMNLKKINLLFPIAILALFFACTMSAGAQAFADDAKNIPARSSGTPDFQLGAPLLEFDEQFHDFGQITKGEKPKHTFSFYNRGKAPLIIDMVSACECTHLDWTRSMIYPGKKGHIYVEYDSSDREGEQEVTMDVIAYKMLPDQEKPKEEDMILAQARFRVFVKEKE